MTEIVGACALDCPDACSWVVTVQDGAAIKLRGNPEHPFTRGGLCTKVNSYLEYNSAPERLLFPLRRVAPKGPGSSEAPGTWERITWDEALSEIASTWQARIAEHGGETIWPFAGTGSVSLLQGEGGSGYRLFHTLGASRHVINICSTAGHAGMRHTTGTAYGLNPEDLAHSGLIVLWGTNTMTTNLHQWPFVRAGREAGAPVVVVDPVRTRTAAAADYHFAPRPGTDAALALGLIAELVRLDAVDAPYLAERALGWEEFRDHAAQYTPERTAEICGMGADEVRQFARLIAEHPPLGIRSLMGMQRHGGGASALRAISCLPAVRGDYARRGGGLCYSTGPAYGWNTTQLRRPDLQPNGPTRELLMTRLGAELQELNDPPITALMIWGANPVVSNPDQNQVRAGLMKNGLHTVVVEHRMTDTCDYADIVLPGTTQLEHPDLVESYGHLYVQWNEPALPPAGEARSHTQIFRDLATALGITDPLVHASDHELAADALDSPSLAGITVESLRDQGWRRLPRPKVDLPFATQFATASGKFEFVSESAVAEGLPRMPEYVPGYETGPNSGQPEGSDEPMLNLISAAGHYLLNSTFASSPRHAAKSEPVILGIHPQDAALRNIADGVRVRVFNSRGSFEAVARVSDMVRTGTVASPKGVRARSGSSVNATTSSRLSDAGRGAVYHDNRVQIEVIA